MSDSKESPTGGSVKNVRRNVPSWMNSRANESKPHGKKPISGVEGETNGGKGLKQSKECDEPCSGSTSSKTSESNRKSLLPSLGASNFSKLLEGVVFALSGFVNPERSILRSQALEMGAEYQPDWNSNCTILICAFPNTPKFRQVEADCGTIVSKEWIAESYSKKKLVDIDSYLMHAGKPWRRQKDSVEASQDLQSSVTRKSLKQIDRGSHEKSTTTAATKSGVSTPAKFSPSRVKKWATDDLNKTISWLESQEEKPEASEIKKIAVEGILTCLQDAIDLLKENQDIQQIIEQWHFIPSAVEELAKLDGAANSKALLSKEELCREAMTCKEIYEIELRSLEEDSGEKKRPRRTDAKKGDSDYDSDETIEMTEEEIDLAYSTVASKLINVE